MRRSFRWRTKTLSLLSIYRVIEQIPLEAYRNVYLVNQDGTTLGLEARDYKASTE